MEKNKQNCNNCENFFHIDTICKKGIVAKFILNDCEYWQPIKEYQLNSDCEEMVKTESKSAEEILKKYLLPIYDGNEESMDDNMCNKYEEILAAMNEFSLQSNNRLLEELEKEFKSETTKTKLMLGIPSMSLNKISEIINKYKIK